MSKRLLILDDEVSIGATIGFIAEDAGFEVRATTAPSEFFELFASWAPTHIALDLIMPEMDGVEVMHRLAASQCRARIIITSGVGSRVLDAARRTASDHGLVIAGALSKPFGPDALTALLLTEETPPAPTKRAGAPRDTQEPTEIELHRGISNGELVLHFQPKVHCDDGRLAGFEALVRWNRGGQMVFPDQFIPLAERTGLIHELTEIVVRDAVRWVATEFADREISMSVNVSARSLGSQDLGERIHAHCVAVGLPPSRVILEVTESSAMEDPLASLTLLTRLRVQGFQLSIDDFGTGFSSMVQLVRLPFSEIKVDKSFVMELPGSSESKAVIRSIIDLGHSLGIQSTAEGVESAAALEYLREVGCDLAQGYYIAKPLPGPAALAWAQGWTGLA